MSDTIYIHYGSDHFDPSRFCPVRNYPPTYPPALLHGDCIGSGDHTLNGAGGDQVSGQSAACIPADNRSRIDVNSSGTLMLPALPKPANGTGLWGSVDADVYDAGDSGSPDSLNSPASLDSTVSPDRGTINYSWRDWCRDNHYNLGHLKHFFRFKLRPGSNVLVLRDQSDLLPLPKLQPWLPKDDDMMESIMNLPEGQIPTMDQLMKFYAKNPCYLDYEKLARGGADGHSDVLDRHSDVLDRHSMEDSRGFDAIELRHSIRFRDCLDGWDCDCVFVMNPEAVVEV